MMSLTAGIMIAMGVLGILNGWVLFMAGRLSIRLTRQDDKINDHREDALQNRLDQEKRFATKDDLQVALDRIDERLVRIEEAVTKGAKD